jgi:hypothetical protein
MKTPHAGFQNFSKKLEKFEYIPRMFQILERCSVAQGLGPKLPKRMPSMCP